MSHLDPPPAPPRSINEEDLIRNLHRWREKQPALPTSADILATGDHQLLAAYVLEGFRAAAAESQHLRIQRPTSGNSRAPEEVGDAAFRVFYGLSDAWALTAREQIVLLDLCEPQREIRSPEGSFAAPAALFERLVILLDIFEAINTLLPVDRRADAWMRAPNEASLFNGRSALDLMMEGSEQMQKVRSYLLAQAHA
jgi:hypothetical protein